MTFPLVKKTRASVKTPMQIQIALVCKPVEERAFVLRMHRVLHRKVFLRKFPLGHFQKTHEVAHGASHLGPSEGR